MARRWGWRRGAGGRAGGVAAACLAVASGGCYSGSLATSTGDSADGPWSVAPRQDAHVGESVEFSFILAKPMQTAPIHAYGLADYCTFQIGKQRMDVEIDDRGGFRARCKLDGYAPGERVKVTATAFRACDARDQMQIAGEWIKKESPNNAPDEFIATASLGLDMYQSHVRIELPRNPDEYDFSTARMVLRRSDGSHTMVFEHRPPRNGFALSRRPDGGWRVDYAPAGNEVNTTGTTEVEFSVYDRANNRHVETVRIATP